AIGVFDARHVVGTGFSVHVRIALDHRDIGTGAVIAGQTNRAILAIQGDACVTVGVLDVDLAVDAVASAGRGFAVANVNAFETRQLRGQLDLHVARRISGAVQLSHNTDVFTIRQRVAIRLPTGQTQRVA